ncbi:MAG: hypothetical protein HRT88_17320, partial [Lentisphaeraceae bacterium]|nr:hypothetical protein [Lentisphaeraceae bacterium]
MLKLADIARCINGRWLEKPQDENVIVKIETDSRRSCAGACFVAFEGERFDAHNFLEQVINNDALALCIHQQPNDEVRHLARERKIGLLLVEDTIV